MQAMWVDHPCELPSSFEEPKRGAERSPFHSPFLHHGKGLWPVGTVLLSIFKGQPEIKKVRGKAHVFPSVTSDGPSWLPHWAELSPTQPNDGVTSSQCRAHGRSCPSARCAVGTALQDFLAFLPRLFPSGYSCSTTFSS